jgi:hypothetical protein
MLPIIACFISIFFVPDSPESCRFLTKEERDWLVHRLQIETGSGQGRVTNNDQMRAHHVWAAMKEWKTWANMIVFWGCACSNYGEYSTLNLFFSPSKIQDSLIRTDRLTAFVYTAPIVVYSLGYSTAVAQLMLIPIYTCACKEPLGKIPIPIQRTGGHIVCGLPRSETFTDVIPNDF